MTPFILTILHGFIANFGGLAALIAAVASLRSHKEIHQVKISVNGRVTELLEAVASEKRIALQIALNMVKDPHEREAIRKMIKDD
jgi:hypothetical protein